MRETLVFVAGLFGCVVSSRSRFVVAKVVHTGSADIVEQLLDLELSFCFFFSSQLLDRFTSSLKFSFFFGTCNVQNDFSSNFWVQLNSNRMQTEVFDRRCKCNLLAVDCKAALVAASAASRVETEP